MKKIDETIERASGSEIAPAGSGGIGPSDLLPLGETVLDVIGEAVRGYNGRENLRVCVDAESTRAAESRANGRALLEAYRVMSPEMEDDLRRRYHEEYLTIHVEARFGGGR